MRFYQLCLISLVLFSVGCATYQGKVEKARQYLTSGQFDQAKTHLAPLAQEESGDQLIYLLDYATTLQISGEYLESNNYFFKAEKLAEAQDYDSISRITGSFLLNEEVKQYKGDTFEKIFINAFLAINYLELGQLDSALVEARRINDKYKYYRSEEKKYFELNPFAKYLSAMIWEADKKYDDAFIAYKEAYDLDPQIELIKEDLVRISKKAQRPEEYKKYKNEFLLSSENKDWYDKDKAELVVIYQQGWGPRKKFSPQDVKFPVMSSVYSETKRAKIILSSAKSGKIESVTRQIYDVEKAAIQTLKDDQASLIARRVGAFVAKEVAANEISRKNKSLGALAWVFMHVSERADLRQWSTLPETIQVAKLFLQPGEYEVEIQGQTGFGSFNSEKMTPKKVTLEKGKTKFINWRSLN